MAACGKRDSSQRTAVHAAVFRPFDRSGAGDTAGPAGERVAIQSIAHDVVHLSLSKQFHIGDRFKAQFRWEAFNVFNRANFQLPSDTLDKANAGTITSAAAGRQTQIGLRCSF